MKWAGRFPLPKQQIKCTCIFFLKTCSLWRRGHFTCWRNYDLTTCLLQDSGSRRKEAECRIHVLVLDENDNAPQFNINPIIARIREDAKIGQFVTFATATDRDGSESLYGTLKYSIRTGLSRSKQPTHVPFKVEPTTGRLTVSGQLDRERQDQYQFEVVAKDGGGKEAAVSVKISILDVNDSFPKFRQSSYSVKLAEDAKIGTQVFTIQAFDTDKGIGFIVKDLITVYAQIFGSRSSVHHSKRGPYLR